MGDGNRNALIRIMAVFPAIALVFSIPIGLFSHSTLRVITSPETLSRTFSDALLNSVGWREQITRDMILAMFPNREEDIHWFSELDSQARTTAAHLLIPNGWVEDQVLLLASSFVSWIETDAPFRVEVTPLSPYLAANASHQLAEMAVNSWPSCSRDQVQFIQGALQDERLAGLPYCQPSGNVKSDLISALDRWLQHQFQAFEPNLSSAMESGLASIADSIRPIRSNAKALLMFLMRSRFVPLFLLGLVMMLVIRSVRELGQWWGVPMLLGAGLAFLGALIGYGIVPQVLENFASSSRTAEGIGALIDLARLVFARTIALSGVVLIAGAVALVFGRRAREEFPSAFESKVDLREGSDPAPAPAPPPVKPFHPGPDEGSSPSDPAS